jgi:hypothetical protein
VRYTREQRALQQQVQRLADDRRECRRQYDQPGDAAEASAVAEVVRAPARPEIRNHREHRAGVQHDQ